MIFTCKEIRERSPKWIEFIKNIDRAILNRKIKETKRVKK